MKSFALLSLLTTVVSGHYWFDKTLYAGKTSASWQFIRPTDNDGSKCWSCGMLDAKDPRLSCYQTAVKAAPEVLSVTAGQPISFIPGNNMGHTGPLLWFMAKVPQGQDVKTWDPTGKDVWFKIQQSGSKAGSTYPDFDAGFNQVNTTIPRQVPSGDYLLRFEHIALHAGDPQFYVGCAQISVTGGGNGAPAPLAALPGVYTQGEPSLNLSLIKGPYVYPAPAVWNGN
ncbi:hypothetical protein B9Z65_5561 [Elsinoe australis]|uniref:lytic cellulose monooxygenase (C4-dehydrogenating) n=1 Tax=Elsinoe australis TaxID=40998 RepID=A0A2P7ZJJ6_9PEZI|nr:hypothetical protein B9Z65_5561 [Elsinoe australis]